MGILEKALSSIRPLDEGAMKAAKQRLDSLTKPPGSLGRLEELAIQLAGIRAEPFPRIQRKLLVLAAADHGVAEEGVSAYPQEVTAQMVSNFLRGGAAINVLARHVGMDVLTVDSGVKGSCPRDDRLILRKLREGTSNMCKGPAMDREEALCLVEAGIDLVQSEIRDKEYDLIATGDMGIGNTTSASAILASFSAGYLSLERIVGRGTGITDKAWATKVNVVATALAVNQPNPDDPIDVLSKVGGMEIAFLVGCIIGAAASRRPVIIDGFISGSAAMVASRIDKRILEYMIPSHLSAEPGHRAMVELMGLRPVLYMEMRLGEGTGAALVVPIVEAATKIVWEMATFEEAGVTKSKRNASHKAKSSS